MENNKLLIGVQFTDKDAGGQLQHTNIELYVLRDITLSQLLEGIRYGISKLADGSAKDRDVYKRCRDIYFSCISKQIVKDDRRIYTHITYTSYNSSASEGVFRNRKRSIFCDEDLKMRICDLGFITSTKLIFDATGSFTPKGMHDTSKVIEAFDPKVSQKIFFPEYNISSRQMYKFDTSPVEVIAPTDPPQKPDHGLLYMILPSVLSIGILLIVRVILMSGGSGAGMAMMALSIAVGITAVVTTVLNWNRQNKEYDKSVREWKTRYQNYIDSTLYTIRKRQFSDAEKLNELYPDILTLINNDREGIYSLNRNLYSRAPQDEDFLTFRIGMSDDVSSLFEIKGEKRDVIFSPSSFYIVRDESGNDHLKIYIDGYDEQLNINGDNLSKLPYMISGKYRHMKNAPLLYSLKNKGALGIVDYYVDKEFSDSNYFISRMIFELCYYHSPEDLQFVIFFKGNKNWNEVENTINRYKFMPHFRGLFDDRSQFVFDMQSASSVMSSLLTVMSGRRAAGNKNSSSDLPHIVFIVFDEHGMKEHAFAEFLPEAPENGAEYSYNAGLTFVFAAKYREYLPSYCDDVVTFNGSTASIAPRSNILESKRFRYSYRGNAPDAKGFYENYIMKLTRAFRFLSAVYYAQIAQNGKVPSAVGLFDLFEDKMSEIKRTTDNEIKGIVDKNDIVLTKMIEYNWRLSGSEKLVYDVTDSMEVPIGSTENGTAYLDLHEKADGPHMLVAGTTGSGKTESIITFLIGLCMQYRPDELNLLLVDMKGGGFTKRIGHLPHVVGSITDVDGDENGTGSEYMLSRFLSAMKSEIKRRKILFNKLHVDSIDAYIKACRDIEAHIEKKQVKGAEAYEMRREAERNPLTHLILVVDEFTELKRFSNENSDINFIDEITTIARVGRSLGFHIILISQNIEGAITDDIRVNCKSRLCLKVATKQASKEMIGTELAASPYMPGNGRAYLLVGTGSKFEYFQSGYSGADINEDVGVEMTLASKYGAYMRFYNSDKDNESIKKLRAERKKKGLSKTELEAAVDAILSVYNMNNKENGLYSGRIDVPHTIFRAPLPSRIILDKNNEVIDLGKKG